MTAGNEVAANDALNGETLVLFFTFGVSLADWESDGIIDREVALYNELAVVFDEIYLFTYGDETDRAYADHLAENISVVPKRRVSNDVLYSLLCPFLHRRILAEADVFKTNQMLGSWTAVFASLLFQVSLVVRTGYILSSFYQELGKPVPLRMVAVLVEAIAYKAADGVITSSPHGYDYIEGRYRPGGRHEMVPNYIETEVFRPMETDPVEDVCYVGRLAAQKNLFALLEALSDLPCSLTIVGEGEFRDRLESHAISLGVDVTFTGRVPNHELPGLLNEHQLFVLPSHFEGMPKSLLEAMSCGLACVGTDVPGTQDVLEDGVTGLLCDTDSGSIQTAIARLKDDQKLRGGLGAQARAEVLERYSLDAIVSRETELYRQLTA